MEEEKSLKDEIKALRQTFEQKDKSEPKLKIFKIPIRAKLSKQKLRRGYITVEVIDENKNISFFKHQITDGTIKLEDGSYHAVDDLDIYMYKGKPFLHQVKKHLNPWNPLDREVGHETYGQKYVMARMLNDQIKEGKKKFNMMFLILLIVAAVVGYYFISKGGIG